MIEYKGKQFAMTSKHIKFMYQEGIPEDEIYRILNELWDIKRSDIPNYIQYYKEKYNV